MPPLNKINIRLYQELGRPSRVCCQPQQTAALGAWLGRQAAPNVWLLRGNLGSGKTTLVRGLLRSLGHRGPVTSPTFNLKRVYKIKTGPWSQVIHVDAYRLNRPTELLALDIVDDLANPRHLVLIEWPENLLGLAVPRGLEIQFKIIPAGRRITARIV